MCAFFLCKLPDDEEAGSTAADRLCCAVQLMLRCGQRSTARRKCKERAREREDDPENAGELTLSGRERGSGFSGQPRATRADWSECQVLQHKSAIRMARLTYRPTRRAHASVCARACSRRCVCVCVCWCNGRSVHNGWCFGLGTWKACAVAAAARVASASVAAYVCRTGTGAYS